MFREERSRCDHVFLITMLILNTSLLVFKMTKTSMPLKKFNVKLDGGVFKKVINLNIRENFILILRFKSLKLT